MLTTQSQEATGILQGRRGGSVDVAEFNPRAPGLLTDIVEPTSSLPFGAFDRLAGPETDERGEPDQADSQVDAVELIIEDNVVALRPPLRQPEDAVVAPIDSCQVTVLTACEHATRKAYSLGDGVGDGDRLIVVPYAHEFRFMQQQVSVSGIKELATLVEQLSGQDKAILVRGSPVSLAPRVVTRTKRNFVESPGGCPWVMLDFDGIELPQGVSSTDPAAIEHLIAKLPPEFQGVTYFYQFSSSAGILKPTGAPLKSGVSAHVFFWLDRAVPGPQLAARLRIHCIKSGFYAKTFNAVDVPRIVYGVDDAVLKSAVQPHYVALPLIGVGVRCVLPPEHRQGLIQRPGSSVVLPDIDDNVIAVAYDLHRMLDDAWKRQNGFRPVTSSTRARDGKVSTRSYYASADRQTGRTGRPFLKAVGRAGQRGDGTPYEAVTLYFDGESSPGSWYVHDYDPTTARHHGDGERMHLRELSMSAYEHVRDDLKWIEEVADSDLQIPGADTSSSIATNAVDVYRPPVLTALRSVGENDDAIGGGERAATHWEMVEPVCAPRQLSQRELDIIPAEFDVRQSGVYVQKPGKDGGVTAVWLGSPFRVIALARSKSSHSWGTVVEFEDMDGVIHEWCIQQSMFGADLGQIWSTLLNMGAQLTANGVDRTHLSRYLQTCNAAERRLAVSQTGWNENGDQDGQCFVLPEGTVYGQGQQRIAFETRDPTSGRAFERQGSLDQWKAAIGTLCEGNSRMILSTCVALAGPALFPLGEENGGFHMRGASSIGKTTTLSIAASVFGHPERLQKTWRTTSNGLEAIATRHNDLVLLLDEMSQVAPKEAGQTAYMLGNGQGKVRATMHGGARSVAQWRLMVLSTGEVSLADHMATDGIRIMAGQEARFIDVAADAGAGHGLFEDLHGEAGGADLSRRLKSAASTSYGTAGRAFIEVLADPQRRGAVLDRIKAHIVAFDHDHVPDDAAGQVRRVGHRFGLVAAVGEACIELGILPWAPGQAIWGCNQCFASWIDTRGGSGNLEVDQAISQVRHHLDTYGSVNYQSLEELRINSTSPIYRDNYGYRRMTKDERTEFLILPDAFRKVVCRGLAEATVIGALRDAGYLVLAGNGKLQQQIRVPARGQVRVYVISADLLGDADPASLAQSTPGPSQPRVSPLAQNYQV